MSNVETLDTILQAIGCEDDIPTVIHFDRLGKKINETDTDNEIPSNEVEAENNVEVDEEDITRRPHCRPLRIKLENIEAKKNILKNAPKIREETNEVHSNLFNRKSIFIVPDKTKMEREADLKLRQELKVKRRDFPQERWKIRRGKVIKVVVQQEVRENLQS